MPAPETTTPRHVLSVSQLNRLSRNLLEEHFPTVWVSGELSNLARPGSGHWYFTLKDDGAQLRCAMFRNRNMRIRFRPEPGQQVLVQGQISLYEARGDYQLIAQSMEPAGQGALALAFEQLKQRLAAEGLFDAAAKQPIPTLPRHIAVVTSPTGAAIRDILTVLARRFPLIPVTILPVPVQGDGAAPNIAQAIARANALARDPRFDFDVIITGRGGGSLEDLWAFNEEVLARAIAASRLPVVSAVGHEVDTTISDLVADARAPTPSAAAEMLSPDQDDWRQLLDGCENQLWQRLQHKIDRHREHLEALSERLKHPGERLEEHRERLQELIQRCTGRMQDMLATQRQRLALTHSELSHFNPLEPIRQHKRQLRYLARHQAQQVQQQLREQHWRLRNQMEQLHTVSPLATLQRGYSILSDAQGAVVTDAQAVADGAPLRARLAHGQLDLRVTGRTTEPDKP